MPNSLVIVPLVRTRVARGRLRAALQCLPGILAGAVPDPTGLVHGIHVNVGLEALSIIKEAFVVKARGGTDAAGLSWRPLSPATIAYGRRHPGLNQRRARAASPRRPLLTKKLDQLWRQVYSRMLRRFSGDKAHAAAYAWVVVKAAGGETIIGKYGNTQVEILRDTGRLLDSISPGIAGHSGHPNQVFNVKPGEVEVGTNVVYAAAHHRGVPGRLPRRPLWADVNRWPQEWIERLHRHVRDGVAAVVKALLGAG